MKRNIKLYLQDIWESTLAIEEYTQNLAEEEFYSNRQVQNETPFLFCHSCVRQESSKF
jgi:uncharacterized protein with HEPN domain